MSGNGAMKGERSRGKYQPVLTEQTDENQVVTETDTTSLLSAMELTGTDRTTKTNTEEREKPQTDSIPETVEDKDSKKNMGENSNGDAKKFYYGDIGKVAIGVGAVEIGDYVNISKREKKNSDIPEDDEKVAELCKNVINSKGHQGAKPKLTIRKTQSEQAMPTRPKDADKREIDIVRKMSEPSTDLYSPWQLIGTYFELKQKPCRRLFAQTGRSDDLALFFHNGKFYAMEAWCTHMGGPLFDGDIEDYNGRCHVMCPWHSYMFDLETGQNEIGLRQKIFDLKYENGKIYVKYHTSLALVAGSRKISEAGNSGVINFPPKRGKVTNETDKPRPERKTSILEEPLRL